MQTPSTVATRISKSAVRTLDSGFASSFSCDFRFPKNRRKGHLDLPALMTLVVAGWVSMRKIVRNRI